jgi:drug/metabolite transporter (DMT)-like permease
MGYLLVIVSSLMFGILPSFQNMAILNGASAKKVLLVCSGVCLAGSFFLCLIKKTDLKITLREFICYLLSGTFGLFATDLCLNLAYTQMPVGLVTMIHFTYPTLVCLGSVFLFHERFSRKKLLAIVLSVSGLILLGDPEASYSFIGVIYALISAFAYAFNLTMVDRSPIRHHETLKKNLYIFAISSAMSFLINLKELQTMNYPADQMVWLILAGAMLMIGSFCLTKGISLLGSSNAAFISTLEPITSLLVSTLLYHYDLKIRSIAGCFLIILSLFPVIRQE